MKPVAENFQRGLNEISDFEIKQNPSHLDKSVSLVSKWVFAGGAGGRVEGGGPLTF